MKICPSCDEGVIEASVRCPTCDEQLSETNPVPGTALDGMVIDGKYRLGEFLQEGGMAWVYRGEQFSLERQVAVKLMKPVARASRRRSERFIREATTAARLLHPHVVLIIDTGITRGGLHYIVSEYLEGVSLGQLIHTDGALPLPRAISLLNQIFTGVEQAHDHGVIHRDLKPDNIMITRLHQQRELVKVLDFGIAWVGEDQNAERLTAANELVGTPAYMAPEQIRGKPVGAWTDIYALGLMIHEMLTGKLPLEADTVQSTLKLQLSEPPPSILDVSDVELPPQAAEAVLRALAKDPTERFASVAEMRDAFFGALPQANEWLAGCTTCNDHHRRPLEHSGHHARVTGGQHDQERGRIKPRRAADVPSTVIARPSKLIGRLRGETGQSPDSGNHETAVETWLVGRQQELDLLLEFVQGANTHLELVAPPGSGRSVLLAEAARALRDRGVRVLQAGSDPQLTRAPWYPVRQLVCQALELPHRPTAEELQAACLRSPLAPEDLPGLLALFGLCEPAEDLAQMRFREVIFSALRGVGLGQPVGQPLCLVIDDADELDSPSSRFVVALAQAVAEQQQVTLLTASRVHLAGVEAGQLEPTPMGPAEVRQLLERRRSLRSPAQPEELERGLVELCHGEPLMLDQAVRLLEEGGELPRSAGTLKALVRRRVALLSDAAHHALWVACMLGDAAPLQQLRSLLSFRHDLFGVKGELERALQELADSGWAVIHGEQLTVCHHVVAEVIRGEPGTGDRELLLRQILDQLEGQQDQLLVRARFAAELHLGADGMRLHERAGDLVCGWLDDEGAGLIHYPRALHVARWELAPALDGEHFFELSLKLAHALRRAGHLLGAEEALAGAMDFVEASAAHKARCQTALGQVQAAASRPAEAVELLRQVIGAPPPGLPPETLPAAYLELAWLRWDADDPTAAEQLLARGAREVHSGQRWRLLLELARARGEAGVDSGVETAREALVAARKSGSAVGQARAQALLGLLLGSAGERHASEDCLAAAAVSFLALGDRRETARNLLLRSEQAGDRDLSQLPLRALALSQQARWPVGQHWAESRRGNRTGTPGA